MDFMHIEQARLSISATNMRGAKRTAVNLDNILPSIRAKGILLPLIVRAVAAPDADADTGAQAYEIVAGKRRFLCARIVAEETGTADPLPCVVMAAGDDAAALEVSLIENFSRLSPRETENWASFVRLIREGRTPEEIGRTFGLTELQVKRTLALGNLLPRIRSLYDDERIDAVTVRHLTMASKARQREWLALIDDPQARAPAGQQLKAWLLGGSSVPVEVAIFDLEGFGGEIVSDLFGDQRYFADAGQFWAAQMAAVEAQADAYREAGWSEVVILDRNQTFQSWDHERTPKRKGGKVFIAVDHRGAVTLHEGYLSNREARRRGAAEAGCEPVKAVRPEVTAALGNYVDLHRHAVVRAALAGKPGLALRVMVAHAIVGSGLVRVHAEPRRANNDVIAESAEGSLAEAAFDTRRRGLIALLGFDADTPTLIGAEHRDSALTRLTLQLIGRSDREVLAILAVIMAEALECGSTMVDSLGTILKVDMAKHWQADDALLDLIRDRDVLTAMVGEVADETVATANAGETGKVKRQIIRDCLTGENGRARRTGWVPRWMAFPPAAYTERGGVGSVRQWHRIAPLFAPVAETAPETDEGLAKPDGETRETAAAQAANDGADETILEAAE